MPVHVAPQAAYAVEQRAAIAGEKLASFGPFNNQRLILGHLGERVPDMFAIPATQLVNVFRHARAPRCE